MRKGLALLNMEQKHMPLAKQCFDETLELMDQIHVKRVKAECYMGLILYYRNDINEAKRHAQMGLKETNKVQDYWMSALLLTALTKVLTEGAHYEEAIDTARQALTYYERSEDTYGQMVCSFWLAVCFSQLEQHNEATQHYDRYWQACHEKYPFFVKKRTLFGPGQLLICMQLAIKFNNQQEISRLMGIIHVPNEALCLTLFGVVQIERGQEIVSDKEWKRMKAKELFLYLYCYRNQFVSKQQLCEAIWQNDEEAMTRDFKVVYNAMLKTLEPERFAREESHFIERRQHLYKLDPTWIQSDMESFIYYAQKGLEERSPKISNEWLKLAISYSGAAFCEDLDRDWIIAMRVEFDEQRLKVMERMAQNLVRLKKFNDVIYWAEQILAIDAGHEEGYRLKMLAYYYLGNRREALRVYDYCVTALDEHYQLAPMETTEQLYELILKM